LGSRSRAQASEPKPVPAGAKPGAAQAHPVTAHGKKRVLFVCIGNSCRSQMAEGFARAYGSDVLAAASAGVSPAMLIAPLTKQVLEERNIRIDGHFPKGLEIVARESFDVIVNMSGFNMTRIKLPGSSARVVDWSVPDPIGQNESVYRTVAAQIEALVMRLILELRSSE